MINLTIIALITLPVTNATCHGARKDGCHENRGGDAWRRRDIPVGGVVIGGRRVVQGLVAVPAQMYLV